MHHLWDKERATWFDTHICCEASGGPWDNGRPVQKKGIVKQPDPFKPPPNNTEDENLDGKDMQKEVLSRCNAVGFGVCKDACVRVCTQAVALCRYLEKNREQVDLLDKAVLELGAGTGLVSIVASLLGTLHFFLLYLFVITIYFHLQVFYTIFTSRCELPLFWGQDVKHVIYHHNFLDYLLITMQYFCKPGTTLLWVNKMRFQSDLRFIENFKNVFNVTLLEEIPQEEIRIYQVTDLKK
uniref:Uncharacterized protein n=1 Tax=Sinocyclocheilus anshuiensis TaxID=1608454 RepID=A0A671NN18_9TELE